MLAVSSEKAIALEGVLSAIGYRVFSKMKH